MESDFYTHQKQAATAFWKSYFAKFQRHIEDHEVSETAPAPLTGDVPQPFPERRVSGLRRSTSLRSS